jgi:CheY-like chemotaxis protein
MLHALLLGTESDMTQILYVEDYSGTSEIYMFQFAREGLDVVLRTSIDEARVLLAGGGQFDAVLIANSSSKYAEPGSEIGLDLAERYAHDIPVIYATFDYGAALEARIRDLGAYYFEKSDNRVGVLAIAETLRDVIKHHAAAHPPVRVLYVEDYESTRNGYEGLLRLAGFETVVATTVDEALALLRRGERFNVILTDNKTPGSACGLDLARMYGQKMVVVVYSNNHEIGPLAVATGAYFFEKSDNRIGALKVAETLRGLIANHAKHRPAPQIALEPAGP